MRARTNVIAMLLLAALAVSPAQARRHDAPAPAPTTTMRVVVTLDSTRQVMEQEIHLEALQAQGQAALAHATMRVTAAECAHAALLAAAMESAPEAPEPPAPVAAPTPAPRVARTVRVFRTGRAPFPPHVAMAEVVTDTSLGATPPGTTLALETFLGDVNVTGWPRNAVRVRAEHDPRMRVTAELRGRVLVLDAESPIGPAPVDWKVWVPVSMPVQVSSIEGDVSVSGTRASVAAQSVKGDVHVSGGSGTLEVSSVEGEVHVAGASGTVHAGSINNGVRLARLIGQIEAQTVNGDIQLSELDADRVDASTVNGSVWYGGPFRDRGQYKFSSHNGTLVVGVPEDAGIDLTVQSFNGGFQPALPVRIPRVPKGKRFEFQLGNGGASLDLESFNGMIRLVRMDELAKIRALTAPTPPAPPRQKEGSR